MNLVHTQLLCNQQTNDCTLISYMYCMFVASINNFCHWLYYDEQRQQQQQQIHQIQEMLIIIEGINE